MSASFRHRLIRASHEATCSQHLPAVFSVGTFLDRLSSHREVTWGRSTYDHLDFRSMRKEEESLSHPSQQKPHQLMGCHVLIHDPLPVAQGMS